MKKACIWVVFVLLVGLVWMSRGKVRAEPATLPVFSTTQPAETTQLPAQAIEFPCVLGNAGLIVTNIVSFEGLTPEDPQEEYVSDALALLIYNPGKVGIISASITLTRNEETLHFDLAYLPPGSRALVVERDRKSYGTAVFDSCQCEAFVKGDFTTELPDIRITAENGNLVVQNLSDTPLPGLTVYYKQYTPYDGFYVGGRAMSVHYAMLLPGETASQKAYGYATEFSRIAAVVLDK